MNRAFTYCLSPKVKQTNGLIRLLSLQCSRRLTCGRPLLHLPPDRTRRLASHQRRETEASGALAGSVARIGILTPMRRSASCGSPKIRPTSHGAPTSAPRVPRRVAQVTRDVPTWMVADQSISRGADHCQRSVVSFRGDRTGFAFQQVGAAACGVWDDENRIEQIVRG